MALETTGIQNFYDQARTTDFSRDFQFRLLQLGSNQYNQELQRRFVFMTTATLPSRSITNQTVPYMGLSFNVPGSVAYEGSAGWTVTFRCPQDFSIRDTLERWQDDIFDVESSTGDYSVPSRNSVVHISLINNAGDSIREYVLYGVYVQSLGDISYDVAGSGAPVTFGAVLAYQYWKLAKSLPAKPAVPLGNQVGTDLSLGKILT